MKNYRHHSAHQISNNYYVRDSKDHNYNLNSSDLNQNIIDVYLDKLIISSTKYIAHFFEDEDTFTNQTTDTNYKEIDKAFDATLPQWIQWIFNLLTKVYLVFFPENKPNIIQKALKPVMNSSLNALRNSRHIVRNKFHPDHPIP